MAVELQTELFQQPPLTAPVVPQERQSVAPEPTPSKAPEASYFDRNSAWIAPGEHTYNTSLEPSQEGVFQQWLKQNNVPFDLNGVNSDYDMRGFWRALQTGDPRAQSAIDQNDQRMHYPDYWKTPYHETFSAESQWADPTKAPSWNDNDQLVLPDGTVIFDDRKANAPKEDDTIARAMEIMRAAGFNP